ncbi:MAG: hypothetical protein DIU54_005805 [Acidobacteriota bacterium]
MLRWAHGFVLGAWLLALPAGAGAQSAEPTAEVPPAYPPFAVGAEITALVGPSDHQAYFNYTGYETNALRTSRIRLFGEWRVAPIASVVGELRLEGASNLDLPALYLRLQPAAGVPLSIQAGRIPPLVGAFPRRAYGRDNAVVGLPLMYQYLTSLRPDALPLSIDDVLAMRGRGWSPGYPIGGSGAGPGVPLVDVSRWDSGLQATWRPSRFELSAAVTRGSPAVPVVRDRNDGVMWSARAAALLPGDVTLGVSGARGEWMERAALDSAGLPSATHPTQTVVGVDTEYGRGPWLVRGEVLHSRFELPLVVTAPAGADISALAAFVEVRYRPSPRWQLGARLERLDFSTVQGSASGDRPTAWDAPVSRVEAAVAYRAARAIDVRAGWQYNWRAGGRVRERGYPVVAALVWF